MMASTKEKKDLEEENVLRDLIWNGECVVDEGHLEELRRVFLEKLLNSEPSEESQSQGRVTPNKSIESKIKSTTSQLKRIQIVKEYFQWIPLSSVNYTLFQKLGKNGNLSTHFRERGNVEYKKNRLSLALRGYNLAICFGRLGEEECGLAYANRAALLLQISEPQLALRDINLAVKNKFPQSLTAKLDERRKKCQILIEKESEEQSSSHENQSGMDKKKQNSDKTHNKSSEIEENKCKTYLYEKEYCDREFFTLKQPNKVIIGAENFLEIQSTEERGRRVLVNQNVEAGSLLLLEKPFVTMLEKELRWDVEHCQICLKRIVAGIPCEHCTFAIYCSEECRCKALKFHQYEHLLWIYLHGIQSSRRDLLATRIIEMLGPEGIFKLFNNQNETSLTSSIPGFNKNGIYDASTYDPVHHLISHSNTESLYDTVSNAFKSLVIANLLEEKTSFFTEIQNLVENSNIQKNEVSIILPQLFDFTASLIFHHLENIPYNAISLSEFRRVKSAPVPESTTKKQSQSLESSIKSVSYASAIFGLLAMCNHSCNPNAVHVRQVEKEITALVALRSLKKDEEVCITYGPLFTVHGKDDRQAILKEKYNFECDCEACVGNWNATVDFLRNTKHPGDIDIDKYEDELRQVHKLIEGKYYMKGIERVKPCLEYFGSNFPPTFPLMQVAQDLFKKALVNIVNGNHLMQNHLI